MSGARKNSQNLKPIQEGTEQEKERLLDGNAQLERETLDDLLREDTEDTINPESEFLDIYEKADPESIEPGQEPEHLLEETEEIDLLEQEAFEDMLREEETIETNPLLPSDDFKSTPVTITREDELSDVEEEEDDTPYKPTYSKDEIARFAPKRRVEDEFEFLHPLDTEERVKRNQGFYKDQLMLDIYNRFRSIAGFTASSFTNAVLQYVHLQPIDDLEGMAIKAQVWVGLENACEQNNEDDPGLDLLRRAILNYAEVAAIWPGIRTLDQLVIAQQKYDYATSVTSNIVLELDRIHVNLKKFPQDLTLLQQKLAYEDLLEQIQESSLDTTMSEILREDSLYMKSTPEGEYGVDPETNKKMANRPLYTIQSALNKKTSADSWNASQPASKVVLDNMRDQLAKVNPNTIFTGAKIQVQKKPDEAQQNELKANKDAHYKTQNIYLRDQTLQAAFSYYQANKTRHLDKFNKLAADIDFLLNTSTNQEKTHYLILSRIQDALDIEERHYRKPYFSYFGTEKSKQDFYDRLDKNDNEYTYPRALREILKTRLLDPLAMTTPDLLEGLRKAQPGQRIAKGTALTPVGVKKRDQFNLTTKSIDVGENGTYYIPAGKKIWLCDITLESPLQLHTYGTCRKSDETHLYLYQELHDKNGVGPFYFRKNDPHRHYINSIKKAGDVAVVRIPQDEFNSTKCTDENLIKTILDITSRRSHTKSTQKKLGAGAFGEVNRAALSFKVKPDEKDPNKFITEIDPDSWVQKVIRANATTTKEQAKKMAEDEIRATRACAPFLMPSSLFSKGDKYWFYMKNAGEFKVENMITANVMKLKEEDYYIIFNDALNQLYNAQINNKYVMYDIKPDNMMYKVEVVRDTDTKKFTLKKQASIIDHGTSLPLEQDKQDHLGETHIFLPPMQGLDDAEERKEQKREGKWGVYQVGLLMAELIIANSIPDLQKRIETIERHRRNRNPILMGAKKTLEIQTDREAFIADLKEAVGKLGLDNRMVEMIKDMINPELENRYNIVQVCAAFRGVKEEWEFNAKREQKAAQKPNF